MAVSRSIPANTQGQAMSPRVLVPPCRLPGPGPTGPAVGLVQGAREGMHVCCGAQQVLGIPRELYDTGTYKPTPRVMAPRLFWGAKVSLFGAAGVSHNLSHPQAQNLKAGYGFAPSERAVLGPG